MKDIIETLIHRIAELEREIDKHAGSKRFEHTAEYLQPLIDINKAILSRLLN